MRGGHLGSGSGGGGVSASRAAGGAFSRNIGAISAAQQRKLKRAKVCIAGLGGIGGIAFELLLRSGIGGFRICDWDFFEESNLNRQVLSASDTMGENKAKAAASYAKKINKNARIEIFASAVNEKNASYFIAGSDIVLDCTDNAYARVCISRACRKRGIPYVFCSALGSYGMCSVFSGKEDFEKMMRLPSFGKKLDRKLLERYQSCGSVLGTVSNTVGALGAMQAFNLLVGWPAVRSPEFLIIDAREGGLVFRRRL